MIPPAAQAHPIRSGLIAWTYFGLELKRAVRDPAELFFTAGLPAVLYVIFGAAQAYKTLDAGNGNTGLFIAISMAAYGAATATTGVGGKASVERLQGWGRQLALTPLRAYQFIATKALVAVVVALIPTVLIFAVAAATEARGELWVWLTSAAMLVAGSCVWAVYGVAIALAFRTESAVSVGAGLLIVLAFLGNIFSPLSGTMLTIAKFTPLYGYVGLTRYPLTEGRMINNAGLPDEPLWVPLLNFTGWSLAIIGFAAWQIHRRHDRA